MIDPRFKKYQQSPRGKTLRAAAKRAWRKKNYYLQKTYGITRDALDAMVEMQNNQCAICHAPAESTRFGTLCIDHSHTTGKVRGLLCHHCNVGIGGLKDSPQLLQRAIEYLEERT